MKSAVGQLLSKVRDVELTRVSCSLPLMVDVEYVNSHQLNEHSNVDGVGTVELFMANDAPSSRSPSDGENRNAAILGIQS